MDRKKIIRMKKHLHKAMAALAFLAISCSANAAEAVYRIVEFNNTTGEFTLAASGEVPQGSWAYFENDYGATRGNRYNQIPRNKKAVLYLNGWQGCQLKSVTLSMCSNNKSGQVGLTVSDGDTPVYNERPADFASPEWFGQWVSKDLNVYVDIDKPLDLAALTADEASVTLQGGTSEGSVYVSTITIDYDEPAGATLESPMGWIYEKLAAKSTIADGDEVMLFRNGCAATDIDGIETSGYLDAVPLGSTSDVSSHDILSFRLAQTGSQWTLTDQFGRALCAAGKQKLAWDEGESLWDITLGYDGATVASANTQYGTLRFNAPAESYARFGLYTSNSLSLPFLYRKTGQRQPVVATSLSFAEGTKTVALSDGQVALLPTLLPTATTDRRIVWTSDHSEVATVNGGLVTLLGVGQTTITATTRDGGATATVLLTVTDDSRVSAVERDAVGPRKVLEGSRVVIIGNDGARFDVNGAQIQ